jgi:HSP20 family protein
MTLTRYNPFTGLAALEIERLNRMFDPNWTGEPLGGGAWIPAVDVIESANKDIVVKAELPEMKREDIKVSYENNVLTIEGQRSLTREEEGKTYHRVERGQGTFRRSFTMPASIDTGRVGADYKDGVLTVTLPRREESRPRQIQVA